MVDRVAAKAPSLTVIARALTETTTAIEPTAMARLLRLLTDGRQSPLLNPELAAESFDAELRLIEIEYPAGGCHGASRPTRAAAQPRGTRGNWFDYARRSNVRVRRSAHGAQTGRSVDRALLANARSSTQSPPPCARAWSTNRVVSETSVAGPA